MMINSGFATACVLNAPAALGIRKDPANALTLQADDRLPTVRALRGATAATTTSRCAALGCEIA